ncbi:hypothetical protein BH18ACT16_BH18ACT16_12430 [soil metagenome]
MTSPTARIDPKKTHRCLKRLSTTRASSEPHLRIASSHVEPSTAAMPCITVVSAGVLNPAIHRNTAASHLSSVSSRPTGPTMSSKIRMNPMYASISFPLVRRGRGSGGGSPDGRRRLCAGPSPEVRGLLPAGASICIGRTSSVPFGRGFIDRSAPLSRGASRDILAVPRRRAWTGWRSGRRPYGKPLWRSQPLHFDLGRPRAQVPQRKRRPRS